MIKVESLLYKIDQRLNKLSTHANQQIPVEDKILAIRENEIKLIKKKLNPNNALKVGFDGNKKRYQDLEFLIEPAEKHKLKLTLADKKLNKWTSSIDKLDPQYMFFVEGYIVADKGSCENRVIVIEDIVSHGSVSTYLNNSNYKPSFEYQATFGTISSGFLEVYTDGTFSPKEMYVSYIRYPKKTDAEGYVDFDDNPSKNQDSELPEYLEDELLDLIAADLAIYTDNVNQYQANQSNTVSNE